MLYPPRWIADPHASTAGAAGGCMGLRRSAIERIGGMAAIRGQGIDDCALARAVKKSGGQIWMGLTSTSVSLRSYRTFAEIRDLIARTAFTQLRYSFLLLIAALVGLFVTFLLAWFAFFTLDDPGWLLASTAISIMTATHTAAVRFYGLPWVWALTLPFAAVFYGYATCVSAVLLARPGRPMEGARASRAQRLIRMARHLNFWFCASTFVILSKGEGKGCIPLAARRPPSDERQGAAPEATMSVLQNSGDGKITLA